MQENKTSFVAPQRCALPLPPKSAARAGWVSFLSLALPPSTSSQETIDSANLIAAQFKERAGYSVVTVIPDSELALVEAFQKGNAHIALLDPNAYALAYQHETVKAAFAVAKMEKVSIARNSLRSARLVLPRSLTL